MDVEDKPADRCIKVIKDQRTDMDTRLDKFNSQQDRLSWWQSESSETQDTEMKQSKAHLYTSVSTYTYIRPEESWDHSHKGYY